MGRHRSSSSPSFCRQAELASLPQRERSVVERAARHQTVTRPAHRHFEQSLSSGQRLADRVAAVGGSWGFIGAFALFLALWAITNSVLLSMLAAIQAPLIMMSQNRQAACRDFEINLKAELEILAPHEKADQLIARLDPLAAGRPPA